MLLSIHYQVHLPVSESSTICLFWTLMDTRSVGDIGGFGWALFLLSSAIAQLMGNMSSQFTGFVCMDMIIDSLRTYMYPLFGEYTAYLTGRPVLVYYHLFHTPP